MRGLEETGPQCASLAGGADRTVQRLPCHHGGRMTLDALGRGVESAERGRSGSACVEREEVPAVYQDGRASGRTEVAEFLHGQLYKLDFGFVCHLREDLTQDLYRRFAARATFREQHLDSNPGCCVHRE